MKPSTLLLGSSLALHASSTPVCDPSTFAGVLPSNASVISAVSVANGSSYGEGAADLPYPTNPTSLPALCAVLVNVTTSSISNYRFGLFLPAVWNSRFLTVGNGGFSGGINWLDMGSGVRYGHAVVSTDTGHNSSNSGSDWAYENPGRREDFGWRAMYGSVVLGKALTEAYYHQSISYSYYSGSSTGGRQGLREAQVDPTSFDGMLITAPAWWTSHLQTWTTKVATLNLPVTGENRVNASLFTAIGDEVTRQCDGLDGVVDGIVSDTQACNFTLTPLLCATPGSNASACLTSAQAETVSAFYADYMAEGKFAMAGYELSSEAQWTPLVGLTQPNNLGDGYISDFLLNNASWTWEQYNDSIIWTANETDPGHATAQYYDAMGAFAARGGKLLLFHGLSDGLIPAGSSRVFYERVVNATTAQNITTDSWLRFFLVPGMQHVYGTAVDAPWYYAQGNGAGELGTDVYSVPGFEDAKHDGLLAVMAWVENGTSVEEIVATTWTESTNATSAVLRQRPLCPLPKRQRYDGVGDVDKAESWSCV